MSADSPGHLLTLKLLSARAGHPDDQGLRILIDLLGLTTVEQVVARATRILPAHEMDQQTTRWIARVIDA